MIIEIFEEKSTYSEILPSRFKSVTLPPDFVVPICRINDQTYHAIADVTTKRPFEKKKN